MLRVPMCLLINPLLSLVPFLSMLSLLVLYLPCLLPKLGDSCLPNKSVKQY